MVAAFQQNVGFESILKSIFPLKVGRSGVGVRSVPCNRRVAGSNQLQAIE